MPRSITRLSAYEFAAEIVRLADAAVATRGQAFVVLAGGTTPMPVYRAIAEMGADLSRWTVLCSDERCLPVGHADRNDTMLRTVLLSQVVVGQFMPIEAERGPHDGAAALAARLAGLPQLDIVVLGIGYDGHTASLFTTGHVEDPAATVAVTNAPKPPPERVSIGASRLSASRDVRFIVGPDKRAIVDRVLAGEDLPATRFASSAQIMQFGS